MISKLNARALRLCEAASMRGDELDLIVSSYDSGAKVLDFGCDRAGTIAGGIWLARICLADLAEVKLLPSSIDGYPLPSVQVQTDHPLAACVASQYAGWPFSTECYFSMVSGPARLARGKEELLERYQLQSSEGLAVGVLEANQLPGQQDLQEFAQQCGVESDRVTTCVARTGSLPGIIQVVSRSIETAMHKLHELGCDLKLIERAVGSAPLPPSSNDDYRAMGWTNDAILYGAEVTLWVQDIEPLAEIADQIPSSSSSEFGRPFIEIFEEYDRDFYKVDRLLFSPAAIHIACLSTGRLISKGQVRPDLLLQSFGAAEQ